MNRREFTPKGVILGVNARGPVDRSVPVLRVDGAVKVVLFQCACHNTTCGGDIYEVSGDYAGFAQAMFMIGCGGDANPYLRGTLDLAREHGASLAKEVVRVASGRLQALKGPLGAAFGHADLPFEAAKPIEELRTLLILATEVVELRRCNTITTHFSSSRPIMPTRPSYDRHERRAEHPRKV